MSQERADLESPNFNTDIRTEPSETYDPLDDGDDSRQPTEVTGSGRKSFGVLSKNDNILQTGTFRELVIETVRLTTNQFSSNLRTGSREKV